MCLTSIEKSSNSSTDPICTQKLITDTSNTIEVNEEVEEDQDTHSTKELINSEKSALSSNDLSGDSFQREFELDDVYPYIKTGIASIIEDEVTQRFVAEELKSWNLLTRTSQSFEFVNIRLTIIWIVGFIFRYCLLLPGRALILIVGLLYLTAVTYGVGRLPNAGLKKWP